MTRALLTTVVLTFASSVATAETITVCLDGWCDYTDIQEAIDAASDGDVIAIGAGTYYPAATRIDTLGKAVTLRGELGNDGVPMTVIDGQGLPRVLWCRTGEGPDTVFENLLITGGDPSGPGGGMYNSGSSPTLVNCTFTGNSASRGGGMNNWNSSPMLIGCTFTGNTAIYDGGGMYNDYKSSPTVVNCVFEGNSATGDGGGMYNWINSSPTLTDTTLCGNSPSQQIHGNWTDNGGNCFSFSCADDDGDGVPDKCGGKGGSIHMVPSEYPTIASAIAVAVYGDVIEIAAGTYQPTETLNTQGKPITLRGAIDGDGQPITIIDGQSTIRVLQCTTGEGADTVFENLLITGGLGEQEQWGVYGGGMYNYQSSPTLNNCTFTNNSGVGYGGGMYNDNDSSPTLTNCAFHGNSAYYGGGMHNDYSSPTLENCTFTGNSADDSGGGMVNWNSSPTLTGCTFTGNSAGYSGGGMWNYYSSSPTLENCTFEGNTADNFGGGMSNYKISPTLTNTILCGNTPDQVYGAFTDNGGNCVQESCADCEDCSGDFNSDGEVNGQDLGVFLVEWGECAGCHADLNADGQVDGVDLGLLFVAWGICQ